VWQIRDPHGNRLPLPRAGLDSASRAQPPSHYQDYTRGFTARFPTTMDDNAPQEKSPPADLNKIDLSQLSGFSFGTSWVQDKSTPNERRSREGGDDRPRRDDGGAPERRDRRGFSRPAGGPGPGGPGGQSGAGGGAPARREFSGERPAFARDGGGEFRGGPRRDGPGGPGGGGGDRGERFGGRGQPMERGPYESPWFAATFYPEDTSFSTLVQTIRKSCRTIELFEVARTVVAKVDRFVVVLVRKPTGDGAVQDGSSGRSAPTGFFISVPDGLPFETEEAALNHVLTKHLGLFFESAEVTIDPPKGNFQVVNRCGVTGELIGPPNFHRYNQLVQQHYAARVARMPFEAFKSRIESVREPEAIQAWLDKMKKATRYTWKAATPATPVSAEPVAAEAPTETSPTTDGASAVPAAAPAEAAPVVSFDSFDEAKAHLLATAKEKVIRAVEQARLHGKNLELLPPGEIRATIEGALERQRRFPLDTANALRGRLRREHFTIFKKGSKGVSYVCAVKRKFRVPGQTFSDSIGALISFIEMHPMVKASELGKKFINVQAPPPPVEGQPVVEHVLTAEQREKLSKMQSDLPWLVREGYVTEFIDGSLYAPLAMAESKKREVEASEHDPENFPDAPAPTAREAVKAPVVPAAPEPVAETVAPTEVAPSAEVAPAIGETLTAETSRGPDETPKSEPPAAPTA